MNLPNKLTVLRMLLVPVFVLFVISAWIPNHSLWAWLVFAAASLTDHFDGKIARSRNQITNFGKFLDPLADKILVISALACFLQLGLADIWCVLIIITREFMVTFIRLIAMENGVVLAANKWGKTKTISQIFAILVILAFQVARDLAQMGVLAGVSPDSAFFPIAGSVLLWIAAFFAVLSGFIYVKQNIGLISATK